MGWSLGGLLALFQSKKTTDTNQSAQPDQPLFVREIHTFEDLPKKSSELIHHVTYPPRDAPVPVITTDDVICTQVELIRQIKESIPMTEEEKDELLFPVIRNLADYVNLLPASQSHHHNGRGGLFRHSLEVGLFAVRMGKMRIFDVNADPVQAYTNKGRWYLAIAIAGFLHDVGKCITDMTVTSSDGSRVWMPSIESLSAWIAENHCSEYYLAWNINRIHGQHENASLSLLNVLVPIKTRLYLESAHSSKLKGEFYEAINGTRRKDSVITELVMKADAYSSQQDLNRQIREGVHPGVNAPIATYVFNIIQELVNEGTFVANKLGEPIIVSEKGIFLVWSRAIGMILKRLSENKVAGVPKDDEILAEKLCDAGIAEILFLDNNLQEKFWSVLPASEYLKGDPNNPPAWNYLSCLKLSDGAALYTNRQRPANTLVLIRQMETSEQEREQWRKLTNLEPPHGQNWFTGVLSAAQDKDAKQYSHNEEKAGTYVSEDGTSIFVNDYEPTQDGHVYPTVNVQQIIHECDATDDVPPPQSEDNHGVVITNTSDPEHTFVVDPETGEVLNDGNEQAPSGSDQTTAPATTPTLVSPAQPKAKYTVKGFGPKSVKDKVREAGKKEDEDKDKDNDKEKNNDKTVAQSTASTSTGTRSLVNRFTGRMDKTTESKGKKKRRKAKKAHDKKQNQPQPQPSETPLSVQPGPMSGADIEALPSNESEAIDNNDEINEINDINDTDLTLTEDAMDAMADAQMSGGYESIDEGIDIDVDDVDDDVDDVDVEAELPEQGSMYGADNEKTAAENLAPDISPDISPSPSNASATSETDKERSNTFDIDPDTDTDNDNDNDPLPYFILVKDEWRQGTVASQDKALYTRYVLYRLHQQLIKGGQGSLTPEAYREDDQWYCPDRVLLKTLQAQDIGLAMMQFELKYFPELKYQEKKNRFVFKAKVSDEN